MGRHQGGRRSIRMLPLVYRWSEDGRENPLPVRPIDAKARFRGRILGMVPPPWLPTGLDQQPFDFCGHMRELCRDITRRCSELSHIEVDRLLFGVTQARNGRVHGLQARVTPLRFHKGNLTRQRRGILYQVQRYFVGRQEVLYLVTFCLPRYLNQAFDDKLITLFHELFHISPEFDGDLRRHSGRYCVHSKSQKDYDKHMAHLAREYLASKPDPALHAFLRLDFAQLQERHGSVVGIMVPRPKLIPLVAQQG